MTYARAMTPNRWSDLPWPLTVIGGIFVVAYALGLARVTVNTRALGDQFEKLFKAGNVDRALKLSHAGANIALCDAVRAALLMCLEGVAQSQDGASYRETAASAIDAQMTELRRRYDAAFAHVTWQLKVAAPLAALGAVMCAIAVALVAVGARSASAPFGAAFLAVVGVGVTALTARGHRQLMRDRDALFDRLRGHFELFLRQGVNSSQTAAARPTAIA